MFQDLFDTQEQINSGVKTGQVLSAWDRLPRSCADTIPLPQFAREPGYPVGLKNQGATCYLNSLLQILFHTPELRKIILELPLCKQNLQEKTDFLSESKRKYMLGFQRLFSQMQIKDSYALSTQYLTDAFGWQGTEHVVQHDIQQAMKVIFDTFERALFGTPYEKNIKDLFRGISSRYKSCRNCTVNTQRIEDYYGLNLQVANQKCLQQSIYTFLTPESMDGDNKVFCDVCESKQDTWIGTKIKSFPQVLIFTLSRFSFNYETFQRIKLTNFYSFNLQHKFEHMLDQQSQATSPVCDYELYGVLIHRGSAHSGHYFCYIRDIMKQLDWHKGLQQVQRKISQQKQKQKQLKQKEIKQNTQNQKQQKQQNVMTQQQKPKSQEKKQEKEFHLAQPQNKQLLQNWFELDDSKVTAIDAKKITTKYEGADCAYILFYRRKGQPIPQNIKVPQYFANKIQMQNEVVLKQRNQYTTKKNQIILKFDGKQQTLSLDTKISDLIACYIQPGFSLVNQAKHNGLPYYPKQINSLKQYPETQSVRSMDLIHESEWKSYAIDSDEYRDIQSYIQVARMPFQINVFYNDQNQKMILYQDQTLTNLKLKIQKKYNIPYQSQIIKLVTAYRQYFVTDDLSNDDVPLTKLGFIHQCQIVLKKLEQGENIQKLKKEQQKQKVQTNTICFVIERDDIHGIKRMYFDKQKTLQQLFNFVCESEGLDKQTTRRFRNLNGDRLFYNDQYGKTLSGLNFDQQIVKIRIQRGEVPIKGDICVIAKMQSKFQQANTPQQIQMIFDPNATIIQVKTKICEKANLKPQMHRVYQTDWMGQPARSITKQKQSIFDAKFGKQEKICIRDLQSPIGAELISLQIFETKIGTPQDINKSIAYLKIQQFKTLTDLKKQLLKMQICKDRPDLKINHLRVRQIKKDYTLGIIMRDNKQLKSYNFSTNKIVVQILNNEQQLTDSEVVLVVKRRNLQKRTYEGHLQLIFEAGKVPTIQNLDKAIHKKLEIRENQKLRLAKYVHYDFQWIQISQKYIDKFLKSKAAKQANQDNKGKNNKKDGKKTDKKGKQSKKQEIKQQQTKQQIIKQQEVVSQQQKQQKVNKQQKQVKQKKQQKINKQQKQVEQPKQQLKKNKQNQKHENKSNITQQNKEQNKNKDQKKGNQKQNKEKNKNKQDQKPKQQHKKEDCLNLRKFPYLLKDGDWIGYGKLQQLEKDDLQTDDDLQLKDLKKQEKAIAKRNRGPEKNFQIKTDF